MENVENRGNESSVKEKEKEKRSRSQSSVNSVGSAGSTGSDQLVATPTKMKDGKGVSDCDRPKAQHYQARKGE